MGLILITCKPLSRCAYLNKRKSTYSGILVSFDIFKRKRVAETSETLSSEFGVEFWISTGFWHKLVEFMCCGSLMQTSSENFKYKITNLSVNSEIISIRLEVRECALDVRLLNDNNLFMESVTWSSNKTVR